MALKTFNIDEETYKQFSKHCKREGLSMSRKVENFIREELAVLKGELKRDKIPVMQMPKDAIRGIPRGHDENSFRKYC